MARTPELVEIDPAELRRIAGRFQSLNVDFNSSLQRAMNEVSVRAVKNIKEVFENEINGGPTPFTTPLCIGVSLQRRSAC